MKAVSEIRKDSIRITDKEGYDVKNIKQKKNRKSSLEKEILTNLSSNFPKRKRNFFFFFWEKRKKKKLSLQERQSKIEIYKKLTHATSNVTFCINI